MIKRIIISLLVFGMMFAAVTPMQHFVDASAVSDSAVASILMDAKTGMVLHAKNEAKQLPMASTTKIMTALLALEYENLDEEFIITKEMVQVGGSSMYLLEGDRVSMRTLVYGMLLNSGNDAANAAAIIIAGSTEAFVQMMNDRAQSLGLKNTHFVNPEGLDTEGHYSSAYDLAILGAHAMQNEEFVEICSTGVTTREYGNPPYTRYLTNHNKLVRYNQIVGVNGIKTGFTDNAGRCLVSSVVQNNVHLICVTLNDPNDWADHKNLYTYGFAQYTDFTPDTDLGDVTLPIVGGNLQTIDIYSQSQQTVKILSTLHNNVERNIRLPLFAYAPIGKGEQVGEIEYLYEDTVVASIPIFAAESTTAQTTGWFSDLAAAIAAAE